MGRSVGALPHHSDITLNPARVHSVPILPRGTNASVPAGHTGWRRWCYEAILQVGHNFFRSAMDTQYAAIRARAPASTRRHAAGVRAILNLKAGLPRFEGAGHSRSGCGGHARDRAAAERRNRLRWHGSRYLNDNPVVNRVDRSISIPGTAATTPGLLFCASVFDGLTFGHRRGAALWDREVSNARCCAKGDAAPG